MFASVSLSEYFKTLNFRLLHPVKMILGCAAVVCAFMGFVYVTNNKMECRRFKRHHPGASVFIILIVGYILTYILGSVLVFLYGIALPTLGIFLIVI